jgi:hypothetical protein
MSGCDCAMASWKAGSAMTNKINLTKRIFQNLIIEYTTNFAPKFRTIFIVSDY